jgi:hypothetical protein
VLLFASQSAKAFPEETVSIPPRVDVAKHPDGISANQIIAAMVSVEETPQAVRSYTEPLGKGRLSFAHVGAVGVSLGPLINFVEIGIGSARVVFCDVIPQLFQVGTRIRVKVELGH